MKCWKEEGGEDGSEFSRVEDDDGPSRDHLNWALRDQQKFVREKSRRKAILGSVSIQKPSARTCT